MADLNAELAKYGIDYVDAMDRVGSADFYKKLAMKYLDDSNYVDLVAAMEVKDYEEGYSAAHALKGVSGNLSLANLFKVASAVSDALFEGEYEAAQKLMPELKAANEKAIEGLEKWQNGEIS